MMPHTANRRTESGMEEIGEDGLQEQELSKLHRQLRVMEGDRRSYTKESHNILWKQESEIKALQDENEEIRTIMKLAQSDKNEGKDISDMHHLQELIENMDQYNTQTKEEKDQIARLDADIKLSENRIQSQRQANGGKRSMGVEIANQKRVRVMENRLEKAMIKFNDQLAVNYTLRQEIDHLRQERGVFDSVYKKLSRELEESKRAMSKVIEEASQAYNERDEAQTKMLALKERSEKDQAQHELEMKELQRIINHDNKLKEFMMAKTQDRVEYREEEEAKKRRGRSDGDKDSDAEKHQIQSYEEAFSKIKEITAEEDIDKIVTDFIRKEDENFALFNYVNELNDEVERLQEEISSLNEDIESFNQEDVKLDDERKLMLKEMETRSLKASAEADSCERRATEICKVLDALKEEVASLFDSIGCDPSTIHEMLGSEDGVTDKNVLQHLGIIEQRTMELLQIEHYIEMKHIPEPDKKEAKSQQQAPPIVPPYRPPTSASINIVPPGTGDDDDDMSEVTEEGDHRPLTHDELKIVVMKAINKHMSAATKGNLQVQDASKRQKSPRSAKN